MKSFSLAFMALVYAATAHAGDYDLTISGDSSAVCSITFSAGVDAKADGTHPLQAGDITDFACTITEADPDLVLDENDLQYPSGLDYRVSNGKVTAVDIQTTTANMLQIGNAEVTKVDAFWQLFGTGSLLNSADNRVVIAEASSGPVLRVGPSEQYTTLSDAIAASQEGDTILVEAGIYESDYATIRHDLTIKGINGVPNLVANEPIPNGKGILVINGNVTIENLKFSDASVPDENGAGIRHETGTLLVRNSIFENNQIALVGGDNATSSITIVGSEFVNNGNGDWQGSGSGHGHGIYILKGSVVIEDSTFRDTKWGHHIKSRAEQTTVRNCLIDDGVGDVSYSVDLPNGGQGLLEGNTIVQSESTTETVGNLIMVSYGEEGNLHANNSLLIKGNTFIDHHPNGTGVRNSTSVVVTLQGNTFQDVETVVIGPHEIVGEPGPNNNAPVAVDDAVSVSQGSETIIRVLDNDTDADDDPLTVTQVTQPSDGASAIAGGGTHVTYTSTDPFTGNPDTFTYTVSDGEDTDVGTVTVTRSVGPPSFAAQVATMAAGEWKQLQTANNFLDPGICWTAADYDTIEAAYPGSYDINGVGGCVVGITEWNSCGWDPAENRFLCLGGGHSGNGGNEVYGFDLDTLAWSRVSPPHALTTLVPNSPGDVWYPPDLDFDGNPDSPAMTHMYGQLAFNTTTGVMPVFHARGLYPTASGGALYENFYTIDPDTAIWGEYDAPGSAFELLGCEYIPSEGYSFCIDGRGTSVHFLNLFHDDNTYTNCGRMWGSPMHGKESMIRLDPASGDLYNFMYNRVIKIEIETDECAPTFTKVADTPTVGELGWEHWFPLNGVDVFTEDAKTKFALWRGDHHIVVYDTATDTFEGRWFDEYVDTGPYTPAPSSGFQLVLDKWRYVASEGVFVGLATPDTTAHPRGGWWMWKPGPDAESAKSNLGTIALDGSTQTTLSVELQITSGDRDYDGSAYVEYREVGAGSWTRGVDLFRQQTEFVTIDKGHSKNPQGYHGMIFGLTADTDYDVRVTVADPDGFTAGSGASQQTLSTVSTKAMPITNYSGFGTTTVTSAAQLTTDALAICDGAGTGHVFTIPADTTITADATMIHFGPVGLSDCGANLANPIVLRGADPDTSVLNCINSASTVCLFVLGGHVIVENLKITSDASINNALLIGGNSGGCEIGNVTVRDVTIEGVQITGIAGTCHLNDLYIADNTVTGPKSFGDTTSGGGELGIAFAGHDIEIEHNHIKGFVDGIAGGYDATAAEHQRSISIHNNYIEFNADDAIETDFAHRNVAVYQNLMSNTANCISFQPNWGGPVYAFKNICINSLRGPLKIKSENTQPVGSMVWNNTFVKNGSGYIEGSESESIFSTWLANNLFCGAGTQHTSGNTYELRVQGTAPDPTDALGPNGLNVFRNNAYCQDGYMRFEQVSEADFDDWSTNSATNKFGIGDVLLEGELVFDSYVPDFDDTGGGSVFDDHWRDPMNKDYALDAGSSAVGAGLEIKGITDATPDIGACDTNDTDGSCDSTGTFYGVR